MSHHLDSPIARQDIRLDITDLYVFRGEDGTVFVINVCHSIAGPIPAPGYHPEGMYEFKVDLDGDAVEESRIASRSTRGTPTENSASSCAVSRAPTPSIRTRPALSGPGQHGRARHHAAGLRIWAGKAGDPFWIEPDVLHAVGHAFQDGTAIDLSGWDPVRPRTCSPAIPYIPSCWKYPTTFCSSGAADNRRIGVWAVATLATDAGGWRSINRVGLPMIHPLFTQYNEDLGNRLNAGRPADDFRAYGTVVAKAIAGVVSANGTTENPRTYGENVAHRFFPNVLPYEVGTPAIFGFAAWNGRSLTDNAPDVMFSIAANAPVRLGIGRESVTSKPSATFPYVPAA